LSCYTSQSLKVQEDCFGTGTLSPGYYSKVQNGFFSKLYYSRECNTDSMHALKANVQTDIESCDAGSTVKERRKNDLCSTIMTY